MHRYDFYKERFSTKPFAIIYIDGPTLDEELEWFANILNCHHIEITPDASTEIL